MGFEDQINEANFASFQINEDLMSHAKPEALFMHCMPMQRNKEVSDTLADSQSSVIFEQSESAKGHVVIFRAMRDSVVPAE